MSGKNRKQCHLRTLARQCNKQAKPTREFDCGPTYRDTCRIEKLRTLAVSHALALAVQCRMH